VSIAADHCWHEFAPPRGRRSGARARRPWTLIVRDKEADLAAKPARSVFADHIVAIARRQDRAAFGALFNHFAPRVKAYLLRFGAASGTAEDLTQETMLAVWRKAALFDPGKADASTWIFTIARNLRISALRRERHPEIAEGDPLLTPDPSPGSDERLAAAQAQALLHAALESLPKEQAEVIRLSFFAYKPHREIERELGIPLGTVKSRLRLAMRHIRLALGGKQ
jgi:RNA polymerase sigma factor (sigma-70 family)